MKMRLWCLLGVRHSLPGVLQQGSRKGRREEPSDGHLAPRLKNIGDLQTPITTKSPDAQGYFNQGRTLRVCLQTTRRLCGLSKKWRRLDPDCAMAYWESFWRSRRISMIQPSCPTVNSRASMRWAESSKRRAQASPREQALIRCAGGPVLQCERE